MELIVKDKQALTVFSDRINNNVLAVNELKINTSVDLELANSIKKDIVSVNIEVENTRKKVKEPYLKTGRVIDEFAKKIIEPNDRAKVALGKKMIEYEEIQKRKQVMRDLEITKIVAVINACDEPKDLLIAKKALSEADLKEPSINNALRVKYDLIMNEIKEAELAKKEKELAEAEKNLDEKEAENKRKELEIEKMKQDAEDEKKIMKYEKDQLQLEKDQAKAIKANSVKVKENIEIKIADESNVPRKYCSPDLSKIKKAYKDGEKEILGVEFIITKKI